MSRMARSRSQISARGCTERFQLLRSNSFGIVLKRDESGGMKRRAFQKWIRSRIVRATTVLLEMPIGMRGIITVKLGS
jgi:hypothetical protein